MAPPHGESGTGWGTGFDLELLDLYTGERDALHMHDRLLDTVEDEHLRAPLQACRDQHADHVQSLERLLDAWDVEPPAPGDHASPHGEATARRLREAESRHELWAAYEAGEARLRRRYEALLLDPELPDDLRDVVERNAFDEAGHEDFAEDLMLGLRSPES